MFCGPFQIGQLYPSVLENFYIVFILFYFILVIILNFPSVLGGFSSRTPEGCWTSQPQSLIFSSSLTYPSSSPFITKRFSLSFKSYWTWNFISASIFLISEFSLVLRLLLFSKDITKILLFFFWLVQVCLLQRQCQLQSLRVEIVLKCVAILRCWPIFNWKYESHKIECPLCSHVQNLLTVGFRKWSSSRKLTFLWGRYQCLNVFSLGTWSSSKNKFSILR